MLAQSHRAPVASPGASGAPRYNRRPSAAIPFRMNVLFEDDGQLKAGTVLADQRRVAAGRGGVRQAPEDQGGNVLLRFADARSPARRWPKAQQARRRARSRRSCGKSRGDERVRLRRPRARVLRRARRRPREAAAVAHARCTRRRCISTSKGKGRYRKAPADALKAALASVERKQREARADRRMGRGASRAPAARRAARQASDAAVQARQERARMEGAGARRARRARPIRWQLLAACGAIASTHDYHFDRFLAEAFPQGTAFPAWGALPPLPELPPAAVRAFSIDDATTTEIDDAFSVRELPNGNYEVGIHIAAPALAIPRGSALDARRARAAVDRLHARPQADDAARRGRRRVHAGGGRDAAGAVALRRDRRPTACRSAHATRVERVPVAANLRLDAIGEAFANDLPSPVRSAVDRRSCACCGSSRSSSAARAARTTSTRIDYSFDVDWDAPARRRAGRVRIVPRPRGSPARQARRRAHDPRQQHVGEAARRRRRAGTVSRAGRAARSR